MLKVVFIESIFPVTKFRKMKPDAIVTIINISIPNTFVVPLFDALKVFSFSSSCISVVLDDNMSAFGHTYNGDCKQYI